MSKNVDMSGSHDIYQSKGMRATPAKHLNFQKTIIEESVCNMGPSRLSEVHAEAKLK